MGASSFFNNPTDYEAVDEGGEGSSFFDGPAYTQIDPAAVADLVAQAAAYAAAAEAAASGASGAIGLKADKTYVDAQDSTINAAVASKASQTYVDTGLSNKADKTYVDSQDSALNSAIAAKPSQAYVDGQLLLKVGKTYVDTQDGLKADITYVDSQDALKANKTYVDSQDSALSSAIAAKAPLASPALTGTPTAPTPSTSDNSGKIATTAFVKANLTAGVTSIDTATGAITLSNGLVRSGQSLGVSLPTFTSALASPVAMPSTSTWYDGPSIAQGTVGTFLVFARVSVKDTANAAPFLARITDGTSVFDTSSYFYAHAAGVRVAIPLFAIITNPAGNLKVLVQNAGGTAGSILANESSAASPRDTFITAIRIG